MRRALRPYAAALLAAATSASAAADEGQWTPAQIAELDHTLLRSLGLRLSAAELWNDHAGLLRAAVNLNGCSAAFVSAEGLVATNHHCAYRAIQSQSSPASDWLARGFVAGKREQELPAPGYTLRVLRAIRDVTTEVLREARELSDDRAAFAAIERAKKKLVATCEAPGHGLRCEVMSFDLGSRFELHESLELSDLRLVYAPPEAVGAFGGEVDNWQWPRHSGDFALLRAYVGADGQPAERAATNVAYRPSEWLHVSSEGVRAGQFVAVLGYPGRTDRYLTFEELSRQVDQVLPATIELYGAWLSLLVDAGASSPALALRVAALKKSVANREKNARGTRDGLRRLGLLDRRRREQEELASWARAPGREANASALRELAELSARRRESFDQELLLEATMRGPGSLALAVDLVRRARERKKPDLEREPAYMDREATALWKTQERRLREFDAGVDVRLVAGLVSRAQRSTAGRGVEALARLAPPGQDEQQISAALKARFASSTLMKGDTAKRLFDGAPEAVERSSDPLLLIARALVAPIETLDAERKRRSGLEARVGRAYFELLAAVRPHPLAHDANATLRLSYATIKGYAPQDGLSAEPFTTLRGAVDKSSGEPPFSLPKAVIEQAAAAQASYWSDPELDDVPVAFLSTADTSGGNSGSPVIDGEGRLVGLNFDRVWENVAGDFAYSKPRSRNISVDIRYLLWTLDRVENASSLLQELGVAEFRSAPARRSTTQPVQRAQDADPSTVPSATPASPATGARCDVSAGTRPASGAAWAALAFGLWFWRRRPGDCTR